MIYYSVVIPIWDNLDLTKEAYDSIRNYSQKKTEYILVNNGSSQETTSALNKLVRDDTILITNKNNIGFSSAVNQGIRLSTGKYVFFA